MMTAPCASWGEGFDLPFHGAGRNPWTAIRVPGAARRTTGRPPGPSANRFAGDEEALMAEEKDRARPREVGKWVTCAP